LKGREVRASIDVMPEGNEVFKDGEKLDFADGALGRRLVGECVGRAVGRKVDGTVGRPARIYSLLVH
jgi:hypothetical protein